MLKKLRIQNFKGWKDTGTIRMAPISLFFGANSSGKSSIGQFLMMLKQTVESPDRKAVFNTGDRNSAVQLGSYQKMVYQHNLKNSIFFEYQWTLQRLLVINNISSNQALVGDSLSFNALIRQNHTKDHTLALCRFKYDIIPKKEKSISLGIELKTLSPLKYKAITTNYSLIKNTKRIGSLGTPVRFYGFPTEFVASYQNAEFVQDLNLYHEKLFRSLYYLGPLRTKSERLYSWSGSEPESVGYAGENTIAAILASRDRKISLGNDPRTIPFEQIIALKLQEMGLIEAFEVKPISEQRQEYEVKVRTKGSRDWVDLPDVGFGISQVLPVLVQCFYAPPGSIILMEQPEIHLHPSAQSALADVMIDAINSREKGKDRNIQLIIETHSEHFLRRLQRRIAEGVVSQDKVSAYFSNTTKIPTKLEPLEIDLYGSIRNWPDNFFGDEMKDITEQAKATMKRRMHPSNSSGDF